MTTIQVNHFYGKILHELQLSEEILALANQFKVTEFNTSGEQFNLAEKTNDQHVQINVLIASHEMVSTEKSTFLKGKFSVGGTGLIDFKAWNNNGFATDLNVALETNKYLQITGKVNIYNGNKSIVINSAVPLSADNREVLDLLPRTTLSRNALIAELLFYIGELTGDYKVLCMNYLAKYGQHFFDAPAAKGQHHNYLGGLLKHSVGLMRVAYFLKNYNNDPVNGAVFLQSVISNQAIIQLWNDYSAETPTMKKDYEVTWNGALDHHLNAIKSLAGFCKKGTVDWNIVFTAILFHDSGKIFEYSFLGEDAEKFKLLYPKVQVTESIKGSISMDSNKGQSHIPLGTMILMDVLNTSEVVFTDAQIAKLNNAILAHHGKLEWGSPSTFEYAESVVVHIADFLDSRYERDDLIK